MISTSEIKATLRTLYCQPEYAIAFEVSDATGGRASRRADAVAMCMWPSRGLAIHGFEIKVHRSDWLRELKKPQKAESIWRYCDTWTLVTAPDVAHAEEIPGGWGWQVYDGTRLTTRAPGTPRQADPPSKDFVAAMLRAAGKPDEDEIRAMRDRERQRIQAEFDARLKAEVASTVSLETIALQRERELYAVVDRLIPEDRRRYLDDDEFAAAIQLVLASGAATRFNQFRDLHDTLATMAARLGTALDATGIPTRADLDARGRAIRERRMAATTG